MELFLEFLVALNNPTLFEAIGFYLIAYGTNAARPSAANAPLNALYFETDTGNGYQNRAGTWTLVAISTGGGGSASDLLSTLTAAEIAVTGAVTATISRMHVCTGTSANYTVTLPTAVGNTGKLIGFRMAGIAALSKLVTLDGNGSETIDGSTTRIMWAQESAILLSDGANWFKIAGKTLPMMAAMHLSTDQTGVVPSTTTKINVDTSDVNNTGQMTDTSGFEIDILRPALYACSGTVRCNAPPGTGITAPGVAKNATSFSNISIITAPAATAVATYASGIVTAAAGDVITLNWYHSLTGNSTADGDTLANGPCALNVTEIPQW